MKSILITIAISVYMTFTVVTIQVANKQTLATSDVTLDMITVMSRAFDEGGEGEEPGEPVNWHIGRQFWKSIPGWGGLNRIICCDESHQSPCRESSMDCRPEEPPAF